MTEQRDGIFIHIEETQAALRESIAAATELAEQSGFLLRKHRQRREQDALHVHLRKAAD